jgi:hypothetical protein
MAELYGQVLNKNDILKRVGNTNQVAGIKALESTDGVERGNRVFNVWTGSGLNFNVIAERSLDISACHYKGIPIAWAAPSGEVHPSFYETEGFGFLRSFQGGLVATCGLDQFGLPCTDKEAVTGSEGGSVFGIHGRVGNIPASSVGHRCKWEGDDYLLEITGEVRQVSFFGENLVLRRKIQTRLGSNSIRIDDSVTNEGYKSNPHMILYHCNFGFPMISENSRIKLESNKTEALDTNAEAGLADWNIFQPPTAGYSEQVFMHDLKEDSEGKVKIEIENPDLGVSMQLSYEKAQLPFLYQWKMMGEGAYVTGIEPANTGTMKGRVEARNQGLLPQLEPGESRAYSLDLSIIDKG